MSDSDALKSRLDRLDGQMDTMKVVRPMTIGVMAVLLAALVFVLGNITFTIQATNTRIDALNTKVDAIPQRLSEEFRAMRAETAAQTSAIANSITAARQVQPQIMVLPSPVNIDRPLPSGGPSITAPGRPPG